MDAFVMSFRALHHTTAVKQIESAASIVALAELEAEELAGGKHRQSVGAAFGKAVEAFVAGVTEDERVEVGLHLEGKTGSIILAALEGDSHSNDDDTGPVETREGGESPSEAADHTASAAESFARGASLLKGQPPSRRPRIVGRLVRCRQPDGTVTVTGMAQVRRRRE